MKLEDVPTPESDYVLGGKEDALDKGLPVVMRSLEKRLALAVAALKDIRVRTHDSVAREALAQIEEGK